MEIETNKQHKYKGTKTEQNLTIKKIDSETYDCHSAYTMLEKKPETKPAMFSWPFPSPLCVSMPNVEDVMVKSEVTLTEKDKQYVLTR